VRGFENVIKNYKSALELAFPYLEQWEVCSYARGRKLGTRDQKKIGHRRGLSEGRWANGGGWRLEQRWREAGGIVEVRARDRFNDHQGTVYWKQTTMYNNLLDKKPQRKEEKSLMPDAVIAFNEVAEGFMKNLNIPVIPSFRITSGSFDCFHGEDGLHPCSRVALTEFKILLNHFCNMRRILAEDDPVASESR
jgi:hypothetical protein